MNDCLWFIAVAEGKYTTRFRSRGVLDLEAEGPVMNWRSRLRHEQVVTRKALTQRLFAGEDPDQVLKDAVACIVTVEEHTRLSAFDKTHDGWAHYEAAGIEVVDMASARR